MPDYLSNVATYKNLPTWKEIVAEIDRRLVKNQHPQQIADWLSCVCRKKING